MMLEFIEQADSRWCKQLEQSFTREALFTEGHSDQCVMLAGHFFRRGNSDVALLLEEGGRGRLGGDEAQVVRAAAVCLSVKSTQWNSAGTAVSTQAAMSALEYARSLLHSPSTPPIMGSVVAQFLSSSQTWPGGDSKPALELILLALRESRFQLHAAGSLVWPLDYTPPGADSGLWTEIRRLSATIAREHGLSHDSDDH
jgi:hypothetical protein